MLTALAALLLLAWIATAAEIAWGSRRIADLAEIPPLLVAAPMPRVSIVLAARDEERNIEAAVTSMLRLDYPDYEAVVVNDRSRDATGAILARLAARDPRLRVVTIDALPAGWLGKNHALHTGALAAATGEWILFTDADIVMEPSTLRRALRYAVEQRVDHLAALPHAAVPGFWANTLLGAFGMLFTLYTKPWRVRDPRSAKHIGIGAFNLIRASAYRSIGGHAPIAMRPDDDMQLGKLVKLRGFRQDFVTAPRLLAVEWYPSFRAMIHGLMKNLFAGVNYSVPFALGASVLLLVVNVWPFAALAVTSGRPRALSAFTVAFLYLALALNARRWPAHRGALVAYPIGAVLFAFVVLRSMYLTLRNGGIEWRGTHYPLAALRANRLSSRR